MFGSLTKKTLSAALLALSLSGAAQAEGFAGAFLAAKSANIANDYVAAGYYYAQALAQDPDNGFIMQGALVSYVASGNLEQAAAIARRMSAAGFHDQYAQSLLIAAAVADEDYPRVLELLNEPDFNLNPLVLALVTGWAYIGAGDFAAGIAHFDAVDQNDAINAFTRYQKALALAYAGDFASADAIFADTAQSSYVNRGSILAHAQILVQLDQRDRALELMTTGPGGSFSDLESANLRKRLQAGAPVPFDRVQAPNEGIAEAFMVLADALQGDGSSRLALYFGRLAQFSQPDYDEALLLIGDVLADEFQTDLAVQAYESVNSSSPFSLSARVGQANVLRGDGRIPEAIEVIKALTEEYPDNPSLWQSLGEMLRMDNQLGDASRAYTRAIDLLPEPVIPAAWRLHYARAIIANAQSDWPSAEADFRRALELEPDQPDVLNYLGYSLVERRENLDEALQMIETAAQARPDSGAIVDSLGWVYYRLGRYDDAVRVLEHAVELLPVDPILNDHLGDALWMVGREREARFQWNRAISFDPDPEDLARIRQKLDIGLTEVLAQELNENAD